MLSKTAQLVMLLGLAVYFFVVFFFLKRKKLDLRYSLLGLLFGVLMLVLALFPRLLAGLSALVGIYDQVNALFAVLFFLIILFLVSVTAIVSDLKEKTKTLTQTAALLEKRLRELEEERK